MSDFKESLRILAYLFPALQGNGKRRKAAYIALFVLPAAVMTGLTFVFVPFFAEAEYHWPFLSLLITCAQALCFITGLIQLSRVERIVLSGDKELLRKPGAVLSAALCCIYIYGLAVSVYIVLPPSVYLGIALQMEAGYYLKTLLIAAALPVLPLSAVGLLELIFKWMGNSKRRMMLVGTCTLLTVAGIVTAISLLSDNSINAESMLPDLGFLLTRLTAYYPPGFWAGKAIVFPTVHGTLHLFHFLMLSGAVLYFYYKLAKHSFTKRVPSR
jgi:hypothetical protein